MVPRVLVYDIALLLATPLRNDPGAHSYSTIFVGLVIIFSTPTIFVGLVFIVEELFIVEEVLGLFELLI